MSKIDDIVRSRIESKPSFLATDGTSFDTQQKAEDHEKALWLRSEVRALIAQNSDNFAFTPSGSQNDAAREEIAAWITNNAAALTDLFKTFYDIDEI